MKTSSNNITQLKSNEIFVFGSNEAGIHGAGAAKTALKFGAIVGTGVGLCGQTYAIPTKDKSIHSLPINKIKFYVDEFIRFAKDHPQYTFLVTEIGCGLAGFQTKQIGPLFFKACMIENIHLPLNFIKSIDPYKVGYTSYLNKLNENPYIFNINNLALIKYSNKWDLGYLDAKAMNEGNEIKICNHCKQLILKGNDKKILNLIANRMKISYFKHGKNPIPTNDGRNWVNETIEELLDAMVYITNKLIELKG